MNISDAKYKANKKYDKKAYCHVTLKYRKDADLTLQMVKDYAESRGESFNAFVLRAIAETYENDKK